MGARINQKIYHIIWTRKPTAEISYGLDWDVMNYPYDKVFNGVIAHIDGLVQDCSNSIANAQELLQSWTKPSLW